MSLDVDGLPAIYLRECEAAKLASKLGKSGLRILRREFERVERKLNGILNFPPRVEEAIGGRAQPLRREAEQFLEVLRVAMREAPTLMDWYLVSLWKVLRAVIGSDPKSYYDAAGQVRRRVL